MVCYHLSCSCTDKLSCRRGGGGWRQREGGGRPLVGARRGLVNGVVSGGRGVVVASGPLGAGRE